MDSYILFRKTEEQGFSGCGVNRLNLLKSYLKSDMVVDHKGGDEDGPEKSFRDFETGRIPQ